MLLCNIRFATQIQSIVLPYSAVAVLNFHKSLRKISKIEHVVMKFLVPFPAN